VIDPAEARIAAAPGLSLADFEGDRPKRAPPGRPEIGSPHPLLISGVVVTDLTPHADERGSLCELLTTRDGPIEPLVHVYQVSAAPRSVRAWVYHKHQHDRLAFTNGTFEVVLYDLRPGSPTLNHLNVFRLGAARPASVRIPPCVVHGVRNAGAEWATFVNMPTRPYDHASPDKCRIGHDDARMPYRFE
jgi:dTDP-4-dehydrorhamnose 3,5-epimerase